MRKVGLLIVVLQVIFVFTTRAQELEIGLKAGMNVSSLGKPDLGYVSRVGYHLGATGEIIITPFFSLQPEVQYSLQGAALDPSRQVYLNYHYLNIPLLARAYFYEDASLQIGVQYGYLIKAVEKNEIYKSDRTASVNRSDFAMVFGLAYKLNELFDFELRYNLGITNTGGQDIIYEKRATNRVLQISMTYLF